jgi:hypothetical protein
MCTHEKRQNWVTQPSNGKSVSLFFHCYRSHYLVLLGLVTSKAKLDRFVQLTARELRLGYETEASVKEQQHQARGRGTTSGTLVSHITLIALLSRNNMLYIFYVVSLYTQKPELIGYYAQFSLYRHNLN